MSAHQRSTDSQPLKAALWMSGALLGFSSMAVAGRQLAGHLDTFEILGYRSLIGLMIVLTIAVTQGRLRECRASAMPLHIGRNLGHFAGQNLWLYKEALMSELIEQDISCPYCGESIDVVIEVLDESQEYIEDCQVCCRPITFNIDTAFDGSTSVSVHSENETY